MTHLERYPFISDCTDLELVILAKEANDMGDNALRRAVLLELSVRTKHA